LDYGWRLKTENPAVARVLEEKAGLSPLAARVLVALGVHDPGVLHSYLHPDLTRDWSDPAAIPGMLEAVDALEVALRARKRVLVFGDFDVDGIASTALMIRGLKALGFDSQFHIPNRQDEGYGLTAASLKQVYSKDPELVITVDCGISSQAEVVELLTQGIDVIITDHHEPSDSVPLGVPVTDPKLEPNAQASQLAGVGVALKLMALLGERFGQPNLWRDLIDLATLGTIADMMPLTGENRSLVAEGLKRFNHTPRPGIAAALALGRKDTGAIKATDLSFSLIPRLNAAGRMGDPSLALNLLLCDDPTQAEWVALELDALNQERRTVEKLLLDEARVCAGAFRPDKHVLVVCGKGWHEGVKGIVASHLVREYRIPVIVFSLVNGEARGSGRSIGKINLFKAVEQCANLTLRFGGHEAAVGVTVAEENLNAFEQRLEEVLRLEPQEDFNPPLLVDVQADLSEISEQVVLELERFEPFGQGNRQPYFVSTDVMMTTKRLVGTAKNHLSFQVSDGKTSVPAIWFNIPDTGGLIDSSTSFDIVYQLQHDTWNGRSSVKMMVRELFVQAGTRTRLAQLDSTQLMQTLVKTLLGENGALLPAQQTALKALEEGKSVAAVMATGRGKSLIFYLHAARLALSEKKTSIFVYPLRALIADQGIHIAEMLGQFGLVIRTLTGETPQGERDEIYGALNAGELDVVLTTPEFLQIHANRFRASGAIGLLVIDEAHHIATGRLGSRPAYAALQAVRERLEGSTTGARSQAQKGTEVAGNSEKSAHGHIQTLAVTATADDETVAFISEALAIDEWVIDPTVRENLSLDDARNLRDRDAYLCTLVAKGERMVIYVNAREGAIALVRMLRKELRDQAMHIAFYHAGMEGDIRRDIERAFRSGELSVIVSTSAFGEGVNVPDIRRVVLWHLPFSAVEFNQMSGRVGRDGETATIHVLYTDEDGELNKRILAAQTPSEDELRTLFKVLRGYGELETSKDGRFSATNDELLHQMLVADPTVTLGTQGVSVGIALFAELGFLELSGIGTTRIIRIKATSERVELIASSRYLESQEEFAAFEDFRDWALTASADELLARINGPILPQSAAPDSVKHCDR